MSKISEIASHANQNPSVHLGIDGSAGLLRGTKQHTATLSQQRVANVRSALMQAAAFAAAGSAGDEVFDAGLPGTFDQFDDGADLGDLDVLLRTANYTAPLKTRQRRSFHYQTWGAGC